MSRPERRQGRMGLVASQRSLELHPRLGDVGSHFSQLPIDFSDQSISIRCDQGDDILEIDRATSGEFEEMAASGVHQGNAKGGGRVAW
jgi:hypothetical protein